MVEVVGRVVGHAKFFHDAAGAQVLLRCEGDDLAKAQRTRDIVATVEYQRVGNDQALGVMTQVPLFVYNNQLAGITQAQAQRNALEALLRQSERQGFEECAQQPVNQTIWSATGTG